jgi:hypothetical protein
VGSRRQDPRNSSEVGGSRCHDPRNSSGVAGLSGWKKRFGDAARL